MIYRKWSLLTGPVAILGGVVVAPPQTSSSSRMGPSSSLCVACVFPGDPFLKPEERKYENEPATK
ncbi:hypothetical protein glysoja_021130 [Glycine soja]|nr:hypothetical protein glysoja_021130 [Glycine soja]